MKSYINKISKTLLIFLLTVFVIFIFFILFKYLSIISLEYPKKYAEEIPYFNILIETSFSTSINDLDDFFNTYGNINYKIILIGHPAKYNYNNYDVTKGIIVDFLNRYGFRIQRNIFLLGEFKRIVDKNNNIVGFSYLGSSHITYSRYNKIASVDVSWNCNFKNKSIAR